MRGVGACAQGLDAAAACRFQLTQVAVARNRAVVEVLQGFAADEGEPRMRHGAVQVAAEHRQAEFVVAPDHRFHAFRHEAKQQRHDAAHFPAHQGMIVAPLEQPVDIVDRLERPQELELLADRLRRPDFDVGEFAGAYGLAVPAVISAFLAIIVAVFEFGIGLVDQPWAPFRPGLQVDHRGECRFRRGFD